MARVSNFKAPNSFEIALQSFRKAFINRQGVAFERSRLVNIPLNRVQDEYKNLASHYDGRTLLNKWKNGYRVDCQAFQDIDNRSAHEPLRIHLVKT